MPGGERPGRPRAFGATSTGNTRVKVNDGSKVSELDSERFEEVPTGGGRFSAWRRTVQTQSGREPGQRRAPAGLSAEARKARRRRRTLGAVAAALLLALLLVFVVFFSPLFAVRSIDVEGARLTDADEVRDHLSQFEGVPMTRISERDVMDSLGSLPQVRSVHISTLPDGHLVVELTERVPVAAVEDGDKGWSLVDQDGTVLRTVEDRAEVQVPVIEGGTDVLGTESFDSVAGVLSTLPSSLLEQVNSAKAESDSTVELELDGGVTVRWGDSTRGNLKAEVLAQLVDAREQTGAVNVYDVSSPEHPVLE